jgi:hypothetical protein
MLGNDILRITEFQREPEGHFVAPVMKGIEVHVTRPLAVSEDGDIQGMERPE